MTAYLVDTDWVIDYLGNRHEAVRVISELAVLGLAVSIITYAELYEGIARSRRRAEDAEHLEQFVSGVEVLDVDRAVARIFGERRARLRAEGRLIDNFDLLIAATALRFDLILVTRNVTDFQRIEDLQLYR